MFISAAAIAAFFKHKLVSSIFILTCMWPLQERVLFVRELSKHGVASTFTCDPGAVSQVPKHMFQGILYIDQHDLDIEKMDPKIFASWFKWLIIDELPKSMKKFRFDTDMVLYRVSSGKENVEFEEVFAHPNTGIASFSWAKWNNLTGFKVNTTQDRERILRRQDFKKHALSIATATGHYSPATYDGSISEYLRDLENPEQDSAIRSGYGISSLIIESLNATEVLKECKSWSSLASNSSMLMSVALEEADMGGSILRIMLERVKMLDYIIPFWPFNVGFTYLAERQSSSNMYLEPFSWSVWLTCLAIGAVLALCQRATARKPEEKEGAYFGVLATWLQQDASAVPEGVSGRWSFMVMSISAMLVHAYYTSAVVSALLRAGTGGPNSLRALADSKYAIASEDFDYMRYLFFDVKTNSTDLEYLKRKKMTSKLYQDVIHGVELIQKGGTAYHSEYNQLYPHFNTFTDDQLCKLQYLDTIPETLTWTTTAKRSQWTDIFRSKGAWLMETGLSHRLVSRLRIKPPPCRASLLAEKVNFGDITPLITLTALGATLSVIVLGLEFLHFKVKVTKTKVRTSSEVDMISSDIVEYLE